MHVDLSRFILERCQRTVPTVSTSVKTVLDAFRAQLDAAQQRQWGRTKFINELSREFKVEFDRSQRWAICGLALLPESQPRFAGSHLIQ
jgi:hypothetical protein